MIAELDIENKKYIVKGTDFPKQMIEFEKPNNWDYIKDYKNKNIYKCSIYSYNNDWYFAYNHLKFKNISGVILPSIISIEEKALRYNEGKTQWSLLDFQSIEPLIKVLEYGAKKYKKDNWKKSTQNNTLLDSAFRHLIKIQEGELIDNESKLEHAGHIMANMMFFNYHNKKK